MSKYAQLHVYLLQALDDIAQKCEEIGTVSLDITCVYSKHEDVTIKYKMRKRYDDGPEGNELAPVIEEFMRRYNWNIANNVKLISPPEDNEIPF